MKLYKELYAPTRRLSIGETIELLHGLPMEQIVSTESIVLSIDELKEVWMAGFNRADPENNDPAPTFQSFLKSKGIDIP